jgi:hypothetical protein
LCPAGGAQPTPILGQPTIRDTPAVLSTSI